MTASGPTRYQRVILKLSGEALMGGRSFGIDPDIVSGLSDEISEIHADGLSLAIVLGGTIASTFVSYPLREVLRAFGAYFVIFRSGSHDYVGAVDKMISALRLYQREGVARL